MKAADYYKAVPPPYGLNIAYVRAEISQGHPASLAQVAAPSETILVADSAAASSGAATWARYVSLPSDHEASAHGRHSGMANVLWLDGYVKAWRPIPPNAQHQELNLGDAQTDNYRYKLVKPMGK